MSKSKLVQIKTQPSKIKVDEFIQKITDETKLKDSIILLEMMKKLSGEEPKMWGTSIIGFGDKRYKSPATGREVDWFLLGFSPRKANLSLHLNMDINKYTDWLKNLGKHKTGKGCLYINKLDEIDLVILEKLITEALNKKADN